MTDPTTTPTPTTPTPPQGLTDERLLELATATSNYEMCGVLAIDRANHYGINGSELIAFGRAAIAAHEAQRMEWLKGSREIAILTAAIDGCIGAREAARVGLHCYLDDDGPCPSPCVFDDPAERISNCTYAQGLQRDGKPKTACPHYRAATVEAAPAPAPTAEEVEARFRAWWGECYPNAPAGPHAVRSHVAFALHLLGGEAAA